ncbi:hypothetical protein Cgig2_004914 [Carnegiea gigantea]|uniref:Uncharacterized protein n=1 Tax=Carnegiea gigantea TaxID=171969 RepID=A0A9Q1QRF3_9CARY|nr:hypothetical protein Cgig2_004914 [Carnegiea gigantea]
MDAVVDGLPSMNGIQLKYLPSFLRTTNIDDMMMNYLMISTERAAQSSERNVLEDIYKIVIRSPIYTIGPFQFLATKYASSHNTEDVKSLGNNLRKQDTKCPEWLDSKESNSVIYVSFGSITTMTDENLIEFAWGLANSNHPFLWFVRPDVLSGTNGGIQLDFLANMKDRGLIASWCDQEKVLSHPSVGNSRLTTGLVQVKELMEEQKGKQMKDKAMEWKKLAEEAIERPLGSSQVERMVKETKRFAKEDKEKREVIDTKNQAESVMYQTDKQLKELGNKVPAAVKEKVEAKLKDLKDALAGGVTQTIKDAMAALNQEVMQLGQVLFSCF